MLKNRDAAEFFRLADPGPVTILAAMRLQDIRELYEARPFRPFTIMADGRRVRVEHPEFIAFNPAARSVIVIEPNGSSHRIDIMLVTDLEERPNGAARRKRKR